jgi:hypothetical protein
MFTSVHSAIAKLSAKLAPRPAPSSVIRSGRENPTQLYKPKFRKGLVKRLQAIKAQRAILDRIQGVGLRALGQFLYSINSEVPINNWWLQEKRSCGECLRSDLPHQWAQLRPSAFHTPL